MCVWEGECRRRRDRAGAGEGVYRVNSGQKEKWIEERKKKKERDGGDASGGREGGNYREGVVVRRIGGGMEGGSRGGRDRGYRGSGCLNSVETLRAFLCVCLCDDGTLPFSLFAF